MIELLIALELLGLALVVYSSLQLFGIDLLYLFKLATSRRARICREKLYRELSRVVPQRLQLVAKILGVDRLLDGATLLPGVKLNLRDSKAVGGRYIWSRFLIILDVPKTCRVEDLLSSLDHELAHFIQDRILGLDLENIPRFVLEGTATTIELLLHGKIRGYRKELVQYLVWCLVQDKNYLCFPLVHLSDGLVREVLASEVHRE